MSYTAEQISVFLNKFTPIYQNGEEINKIPDGVKITVYCDDFDESGFVENITHDQMGMEELIAKSWILQSELENLLSVMPTASNNIINQTSE